MAVRPRRAALRRGESVSPGDEPFWIAVGRGLPRPTLYFQPSVSKPARAQGGALEPFRRVGAPGRIAGSQEQICSAAAPAGWPRPARGTTGLASEPATPLHRVAAPAREPAEHVEAGSVRPQPASPKPTQGERSNLPVASRLGLPPRQNDERRSSGQAAPERPSSPLTPWAARLDSDRLRRARRAQGTSETFLPSETLRAQRNSH